MKKTIESKVRIRFADCDPFNHLNNARYLDYIMNAREDQIRDHYDFDIHQMGKEAGVVWVVAQNQISYLQPALLSEIVIIETCLLTFSEKTILLEALMWNEDKTALKAVMWSKQVHYHLRTQQTHPHSEALATLFSKIVCPVPENLSFEDRVRSLKKSVPVAPVIS